MKFGAKLLWINCPDPVLKMKEQGVIKIIVMILFAGFIFAPVSGAQVNIAKEHFERGAEYHLHGKNKEAIEEFKKSLLYNKKDPNTHFYLSLVYDVTSQIAKAIQHMLKAEEYFEAAGRDYWKKRSRKRINEFYFIYDYKKEDFEKTEEIEE